MTESSPHVFLQSFKRCGTFILLLLIPYQFYFDVHGSLSITVVEMIILVLLGVSVMERNGLRLLLSHGHPLSMYVLLFGLSMIVSTAFAHDFVISAKYCCKWLLFLSAFFVIARCAPLLRSRDTVFVALALAGCTSTAIGLMLFRLGPDGFEEYLSSHAASLFIDSSTLECDEHNWFRGGGAGGTFFNRNWYSAFLGAVLPYCIIRAFLIRRKRMLWTAAAVLLFIGLVVSLSRGAWLGMIGFIFLLIILFMKRYRKVLCLIITGGIVILSTLILLSPELWSSIVERSTTILVVDSRVNRINMWSVSLNTLMYNPVVGIGIANIPVGSAHSNYLQILAEQGIAGLAIFVTLLITIFRLLYGTIKSTPDQEEFVFGAGLLGSWTWFVFQGIPTTTFYNDKIYATFSCLLGITAFYLRKQNEGDELSDMK